MQSLKNVSAVFVMLLICLMSFPRTAQQSGPQLRQGSVSDDDLVRLHQQIKELKNPTFRAFLRMRLLGWESPEPGPTRRRIATEVATQGVNDLCEHQNEVWSPTASWLYGNLVKQLKTLQSQEETTAEICVLKSDPKNDSAKDFSSAIRMLSNPETSAAGLNLAKAAVLSAQVSPEAILGHLLSLRSSQSPHFSELLSTVLALEEKQPGSLPLRIMPFFPSLLLNKSVALEMQRRFLFVAVRSSRLSAEELANPSARSSVRTLLNGIVIPAQRLTPELFPEIVGRLNSLNVYAPNMTETWLAAEERIQKASDQLEQLISEANSASNEYLKKEFFFRAARLAKDQGQLSKAVDLVAEAANVSQRRGDDIGPLWMDNFLLEIVSLAVKKQSPSDATYAIAKMTRPLVRAKAFHLLGEHYGENKNKVSSKDAFTQSVRQLKSVDNSYEKVTTSLLLAESVLRFQPADAYEVFREAVKTINNLPVPEKDQEKMYFVRLMPVAEELIRRFRLLATRDSQSATSLAAEIKLPELRLSAVSGIYSAQ